MSLLLASLFSRKTANTGLMIYDVADSDVRYMQLVDVSELPLHLQQTPIVAEQKEQEAQHLLVPHSSTLTTSHS